MIDTVLRALRMPSDLAVRSNTARVKAWLIGHSMRVGAAPMFWPGLWSVADDTDGSVLLVPLCDTDPGLAIIPSAAGYEVLICDPDDMDEIGHFDTIEDSLAGIVRWFALPCRTIEIAAELTKGWPSATRLQ